MTPVRRQVLQFVKWPQVAALLGEKNNASFSWLLYFGLDPRWPTDRHPYTPGHNHVTIPLGKMEES